MAHDLQDDLEVVAAGDDYSFDFDDDAGGDGFQTSGGAASQSHDMVRCQPPLWFTASSAI